jgi:hypothetical protein
VDKKKLFEETLKKWIPILCLGYWRITTEFCDSHEFIRIENSTTALAFCHANWTYLTAIIRVNNDHLQEEEDSRIVFIVVYELGHCLLNEMREEGIDHEERVATLLAQSFLNAEKISCVK